MPPKEELFRRFENVVETRRKRRRPTLRLTWRRFGIHVFVREEEQDENFVYTITLPGYALVDSQWPDKSIHDFLRDSFFWPSFQRVIQLPNLIAEQENVLWMHVYWNGTVVVAPSGLKRGVWRCAKPSQEERKMWFHGEHVAIQNELLHLYDSHREEWKAAMQWAQWSDEERFWSLVSWERGNQDEWCQLVQAAFGLGLVRRQTKPDRVSWPMFLLYSPRFPQAPLQIEKRSFWPSAPVWELLRLAQQRFGARVNYNWSRMPPHEALNPPRVQALRPSQHELMQALDLWRDFGRKSGQLSRVEELLRELLP